MQAIQATTKECENATALVGRMAIYPAVTNRHLQSAVAAPATPQKRMECHPRTERGQQAKPRPG